MLLLPPYPETKDCYEIEIRNLNGPIKVTSVHLRFPCNLRSLVHVMFGELLSAGQMPGILHFMRFGAAQSAATVCQTEAKSFAVYTICMYP